MGYSLKLKEIIKKRDYPLRARSETIPKSARNYTGSFVVSLYYKKPFCGHQDQDYAAHLVYTKPEVGSTIELIIIYDRSKFYSHKCFVGEDGLFEESNGWEQFIHTKSGAVKPQLFSAIQRCLKFGFVKSDESVWRWF